MEPHCAGALVTAEALDRHPSVRRVIYPGLPIHLQHEPTRGTDSLIEHPVIMTHASFPAEQRRAIGIRDSLVRLSIGIEDAGDLKADLEQALSVISRGE